MKTMIRIKRCAEVVVLIILFTNYNGYTQQNTDSVFSLKQCVDLAIANNIQVKQTELQTQTDNLAFKQAKNNRLPELSANVNHGINQGRSIDPFTNNYINQLFIKIPLIEKYCTTFRDKSLRLG